LEKEEIISSGLLESYVMGLCSHEESLQVEWWSKAYPEVRAELEAIGIAMEKYAMAAAIPVASDVKSKIFAAIEKEATVQEEHIAANDNGVINESIPATVPETAVIRPMLSKWKILAAASVILFVASAIFNFVTFNKLQDATAKLNQTEQDLVARNEAIAEMDKNVDVVQDKNSIPVSLAGLPAAPNAAAKIFWMKNTGDVYIDASNLPAAPQGMEYQLWGIVDGKPVDAGMITTASGSRFQVEKMKSFGSSKIEAFAVTLETKGGKPQPEGEMYVLGKL
jgi:hypothetical protein